MRKFEEQFKLIMEVFSFAGGGPNMLNTSNTGMPGNNLNPGPFPGNPIQAKMQLDKNQKTRSEILARRKKKKLRSLRRRGVLNNRK